MDQRHSIRKMTAWLLGAVMMTAALAWSLPAAAQYGQPDFGINDQSGAVGPYGQPDFGINDQIGAIGPSDQGGGQIQVEGGAAARSAPTRGGTLPVTGSDLLGLAVIAAIAVAVGAGLLRAGRHAHT